ncbi:MFS transporter [Leifsonia sp. Leaf264]|uniref:MFS transporter n=1 Tax=Leifsonia sp. Leaf264 TaxID=1736314 RepID=UPI0006F25EFF|nr:MFS transporter [Leifsonia sp. Leaf264]KQO98181.1 hypothetical protein ASF30_08970 [Leifsonia sp. Leaf264]
MFRSFAIRNYRLWFTGAFLSSIGGWMQSTAVSWIALTELTDYDAVAVGITIALQFGPRVFLLPVTGWVADRFERRKTILVTQATMMATGITFGIALLAGTAQLWQLYLISAIIGVVGAVENPTKQAFVPSLVPESMLSNVVALEGATYNTARMIGPAAGGLLLATVDPGWLFVANGLSFGAVISMLLLLRTADIRDHRTTKAASSGLVVALRHIRTDRSVMIALAMILLIGSSTLNFSVYVPAMVVEFGGQSSIYGLISSVMAAGAVLGALLAARTERPGVGRMAVAAGFAAVAALAAASSPNLVWFTVACFAIAFANITITAAVNGHLQTSTPAHLRGRVMATLMAVLAVGALAGAPALGAVVNEFGAQTSLIAVSVASAIAAALWFATRRPAHPPTPATAVPASN